MPDYVDNLAKPSRWERLRDVFTKKTWDDPILRKNIDSLIDAMPTGALSIKQLAQDPKVPQSVKAMLQHLIEKFPKKADIVRYSKFVDELKAPPGYTVKGEYLPKSDISLHALNDSMGLPISDEGLMRNIGHEIFGHGRQRSQLGKEAYQELQRSNVNVPYIDRAQEQKARRSGEALIKYFKKVGWL